MGQMGGPPMNPMMVTLAVVIYIDWLWLKVNDLIVVLIIEGTWWTDEYDVQPQHATRRNATGWTDGWTTGRTNARQTTNGSASSRHPVGFVIPTATTEIKLVYFTRQPQSLTALSLFALFSFFSLGLRPSHFPPCERLRRKFFFFFFNTKNNQIVYSINFTQLYIVVNTAIWSIEVKYSHVRLISEPWTSMKLGTKQVNKKEQWLDYLKIVNSFLCVSRISLSAFLLYNTQINSQASVGERWCLWERR